MREKRGKQNTDKRKGTAQNSDARKKTSAPGRSARADRPSGLPRRSAPSHQKQTNSDCGLAPSQNFRPRRPAARKRKQTDGYHTKILGEHFHRATHLTKLIHPAAKTRRRSAPSIPNLGNASKEQRKQAQNKWPRAVVGARR